MNILPGTRGRRRLYVMRHGHVDYFKAAFAPGGVDAVPLTARGREEAEAAGLALKHIPFDMALCSGLPRAEETARIVLSHQDQEDPPVLHADGRLREIKGGGARARAKIGSLKDLATEIYAYFEKAAEPGARLGPEGELFTDAYERAVEGVEACLAESAWRRGLIVAHEGINRLLLSWAANGGLAAAGAFEQDTACVNVIDVDMALADGPDGGKTPVIERKIIKAVNLTPYNYVKHGMYMTSLEAIFSTT